jgi:hypothetical protein
VNFLRADFVGKRAEGGINGPLPHTRTFTCKVEN